MTDLFDMYMDIDDLDLDDLDFDEINTSGLDGQDTDDVIGFFEEMIEELDEVDWDEAEDEWDSDGEWDADDDYDETD